MVVVFILLAQSPALDARAVIAAFAQLAPNGPRLTISTQKSGPDVAAFEVDDVLVAVTAIDSPVPKGEADQAARFSVAGIGGWKLPRHAAHFIVGMLPGDGDPVRALRLFTVAVAAIGRAHHAVGVYDGQAHATHPMGLYADGAASELPVPLWVGVSAATDAPKRLSLLSLGMNRFGLPDLLFTYDRHGRDPGLGVETFYDLLAYAIAHKAAPRDGETIGPTADAKWEVRYVPSPIDKAVKVWRVDAHLDR